MVLFSKNSGLFSACICATCSSLLFGWQRPLLRNTQYQPSLSCSVELPRGFPLRLTLSRCLYLYFPLQHTQTPYSSFYLSSKLFPIWILEFITSPASPFFLFISAAAFSPLEDFILCSEILFLPIELIAWFPYSSLVHPLVNICWFYLI